MGRWLIVHPEIADKLPAGFSDDCERVIASRICPPGTAYKIDPDQMVMTDLKTGDSWTMRDRPPKDEA